MITKGLYPKGIPHPDNGIYLLPERGGMDREWRRFRDTTRNAANFGFANRMFLGLMLQNAVENTVRAFGMKLLYDSPIILSGRERRKAGSITFTERAPVRPEAWKRWREPPSPITGNR